MAPGSDAGRCAKVYMRSKKIFRNLREATGKDTASHSPGVRAPDAMTCRATHTVRRAL